MRAELELDRAATISHVIGELDEIYRLYDNCRDCQSEFYFVSNRRAALKRVRDALSDEEWCRGELPPVLPE